MLGGVSHSIVGFFGYDEDNNTFQFNEVVNIFGKATNSLVDFYTSATDVLLIRPKADGTFQYMGGTGYAANNAPVQWDRLGSGLWHTAASLASGLAGIGDLAVGSKFIGILSLAVCVGEAYEARQNMEIWTRSIHANISYKVWTEGW